MGRKRYTKGKNTERNKICKKMRFSKSSLKIDNFASKSGDERFDNNALGLKEIDVGITEYVSKIPGFVGIMKSRFSDFLVNEIDWNGKEVALTTQDIPKMEENELDPKEYENLKSDLEHILTTEIWEKLKLLRAESLPDNVICIKIGNLEKNDRTKIHKMIKYEFGSEIITSTEEIEGEKVIKCCSSKKSVKSVPDRVKWLWPAEYIWFVIYKENVDTLQAASDLARNLRLQPSRIFYAGTKDKRAKTCQQFCIKKREPFDIMRASRKLKYMQLGNFSIHSDCLQLGKLTGNRFQIILRNVCGDNKQIEEALESLASSGFINYYGLQRFGNNASIPTYHIGLAILRENYKEACELILKPRDGDSSDMKQMRDYWWTTRDSVKAATMLRNDKFVEKKLLEGFAFYGETDYGNALMRLPRNMLLLYIHAYQSYIWNLLASKRIKEFGTTVLVGDIVSSGSDDPRNPLDICISQDQIDDDVLEDTNNVDDNINSKIEKREHSKVRDSIKRITANDIEENKYNIFDVFLPLPGFDVQYPSNVTGQWIEELLSADGLSSKQFKHKVKAYSLSGTYRKILCRPEKLKWDFKNYNSPTSILIQSDYDKLKGIQPEPDIPDGKLKSLILDFRLPSSSYATMALREILKCDTSSSYHRKLDKELTEKE